MSDKIIHGWNGWLQWMMHYHAHAIRCKIDLFPSAIGVIFCMGTYLAAAEPCDEQKLGLRPRVNFS